MKIITFWGGLGNQIFEYAYYQWLRGKYPNERFFGYYPTVGLSDHNGLEIDKRFDVELPKTSLLSDLVGVFLFNVNRICRRLHLPLLCTCTQNNGNYGSIFHCDYWQDKKYLTEDFFLKFNIGNPSVQNNKLLGEIKSSNSVAIHIRRGDYLKPKVNHVYGGICTEDYYNRAIKLVENSVDNPHFIFFSNDIQYVKDKFHLRNMSIVDWNKGEDSIWDMYLMSKCKYMILANSTFSYWAARLNNNVNMVICPNKWTNINPIDIVLDNWKKI